MKLTRLQAVPRKMFLFQFDMELVKTVIWTQAVVDKEPHVVEREVDVVMTTLKEVLRLLLVMTKNFLRCKPNLER